MCVFSSNTISSELLFHKARPIEEESWGLLLISIELDTPLGAPTLTLIPNISSPKTAIFGNSAPPPVTTNPYANFVKRSVRESSLPIN